VAHLPEIDVTRILEVLTARGVDYVVIGGIAAVLHGSATITNDVDVCFATDEANLATLGTALVDLDARLRGVDEDLPFVPDAAALRRIRILTLDTVAGPLDVQVDPQGAPPYAELRRRAERVDVGGFAVLIASLEDLIAMKLASGREKDLIAVEELETIRDLRARGIRPEGP
jgi:predicted nucleotidyltransferase